MEQDLVNRAITEGEAYRGRIEFVNLSNLTFAALLAKLERVQENSAIMYQVLQLDAEGKVFVPASAAREIARSARAPVYGMLDTYLGSGIAGGFLIHNDGLGRRAAQIGAEILQGKRAPGIPYTVEPIGSLSIRWPATEALGDRRGENSRSGAKSNSRNRPSGIPTDGKSSAPSASSCCRHCSSSGF